jgi:hypothetical protein
MYIYLFAQTATASDVFHEDLDGYTSSNTVVQDHAVVIRTTENDNNEKLTRAMSEAVNIANSAFKAAAMNAGEAIEEVKANAARGMYVISHSVTFTYTERQCLT